MREKKKKKNIREPGRGKRGKGGGGVIRAGSAPGPNHLDETTWLLSNFNSLLLSIELDKHVMFLLQEKLDGLHHLREQQDNEIKSTD